MNQPTQKPTVIIIDDESHIRLLLRRFLEDDYEVVEFATGNDFLEKAQDLDPSTIIIDWMMPGLSGIETIKEMKKREIHPSVPVALNTAVECTEESMKEAVDAGITIFLQKGVSWHYIIKHVEALVELYEAQKRQKEMTNLIVHSMQHNINGLLTGIVTIGSMLPMFEEWGEGMFFDKINQMIESSQQLHELNEDLQVLLADSKKIDTSELNIFNEISKIEPKLTFHNANVEIVCNKDFNIKCGKKEFSRMLYYMGLYFIKTIGIQHPIIFDIQKNNDHYEIKCQINGKANLSELFITSYAPNTEQGTFLLAATFVRKTVQKYKGKITLSNDNDKSTIQVTLPI